MESKTMKLIAAGIIAAITGVVIWRTVKKSPERQEEQKKKDETRERLKVELKPETDNRPESSVLITRNPGEIYQSYDLEKYQRDTYQVGYELTALIEREFESVLEEGVDFDRFDGQLKPESKYLEIHFDGRYRANILFHIVENNSVIEDEVESIFYSEYIKGGVKRDGVKASLNTNKHIVIDKGTYKSFADLAYGQSNNSKHEIVAMKIQLGRLRLEDLVDIMILFKSHGYKSILMY